MDRIVGSLDNITYVAIQSKYEGKWVLSYHRWRQRCECPGGHVEPGETPLAAAKRELYEETGAVDFDIIPVWDFDNYGSDGTFINNGRVYFAEISSFGNLPEGSEMERIGIFDELPQEVTYNRENMISGLLRAEKYASAHYI